MKPAWQDELEVSLRSEILLYDSESLRKYSKDFHHFSPVLADKLNDKIAECIVKPQNEQELEQTISIACKYKIPLTVRGGGTGNYGQCVPLSGGIVVDLSMMEGILEITNQYMRVQPGARLGKMEKKAREIGMEMMMFPSTFLTATIGGFLSGGFGGIGTIRWGTIWDGFVESITVKTIEETPKTIVLTKKEEIEPFLHSYGTIGILSEMKIHIVPKVEWAQMIVSFSDWEVAANFAREVAENQSIDKRLVTYLEDPIPSYFKQLHFQKNKSAVLIEISKNSEKILINLAKQWKGTIDTYIPPEKYHQVIGVSDFSFNHTTLWVRKVDPTMTYLQIRFDRTKWLEQIKMLKEEFPDISVHIEFIKRDNEISPSGLPILPCKSEEYLNQVMARCEEIGIGVDNPHTSDLEADSRAYATQKLLRIKRENDPHNILNPNKLQISM